MKKSMRIAIMAVAICMVLGAWAVVYAKAETEKSGAGAIVTSTTMDAKTNTTTVSAGTASSRRLTCSPSGIFCRWRT